MAGAGWCGLSLYNSYTIEQKTTIQHVAENTVDDFVDDFVDNYVDDFVDNYGWLEDIRDTTQLDRAWPLNPAQTSWGAWKLVDFRTWLPAERGRNFHGPDPGYIPVGTFLNHGELRELNVIVCCWCCKSLLVSLSLSCLVCLSLRCLSFAHSFALFHFAMTNSQCDSDSETMWNHYTLLWCAFRAVSDLRKSSRVKRV